MSKVLLINGSSRQEGNTALALAEVAGALEGHGIECETLWLGNKPVNDCIACGKCTELMRAGSTAGCVIRDEVYLPIYRRDVKDKK